MNKYQYNLQTFLNEDHITYYLLGAFMTDGCVYTRKNRPNSKVVTISSKDKDWLELINSKISPNKTVLPKGKNCFYAMYMSSELGNWFESKGCTSRKSLILQMPNIPEKYIWDFISGCWDGDGSLSFTKIKDTNKFQCQANLTSGSLDFCNQITQILCNNKIKCKVYPHGRVERKIEGRVLKPGNAWRVVLSGGGSVYNLVKNISNNELCMPRKLEISRKIIRYREEHFPE